jgi:predicted phosphodiesterase
MFLEKELWLSKDNILIISDTHIPFEIKHYLDFCLEIKNRVKCDIVVHIGDLVDNHSISYHEHDPDGYSPKDELIEARKRLKKWFKMFPKLYLCRGNHDRMVDRKGKTNGLPLEVFRPFREIWELPKGWVDDFQFTINDVVFEHGTGYSGDNAHLKASYNNRQSTVMGHTHSHATVGYLANEKDCIFGMNVGCGINRHTYAFEYGRDFKKKPIISCGVVTDRGKYAQVFPMSL